MSSAASLVKRGTPSAWPHELCLIMDQADPLYQPERLEREVTDERIRNFAGVGQVEPVLVRVVGDNVEIVAGCQRHKRASVINAVVGVHAYDGPLRSVREAIKRVKADKDFAAWICEQMPNGMKLKFDIYRGKANEAVRAQTSENEQRDDDPLASKIRRAHRLAKAGFSTDDIASDFGQTANMITRWLKRDPDKPREKKTRAPAKGPSRKRITALAASEHIPPEIAIVLRWVVGDASPVELSKHWPAMAKALEVQP